jgi:hypothetical protein
MSVKIEDIDTGWRATKRALAGLDGLRVDAGLFDGENASKGAYNEFGTARIPPRPWLSIAADTNYLRLGTMTAKAVEHVADRKATALQAITPIGLFMRDAARSVIEQQRVGGPPLAPDTIERKGHDDKLVDSGDLLAAIDFEISQDGDDE